jgi:transposase
MAKKTLAAALSTTATERRRTFSEAAKRRIVAEASRPGSSFSAVARRYHIDLRLLFRWRQALGMAPAAEGGSFLPVRIAGEAVGGEAPCGTAAAPGSLIVERPVPGIEIELVGGRRVRFDRDVDPETMKRVISTLEGEAAP